MPVSDNTRAVLEEMRKNGVSVEILAGLERELDSKPNADKVVNDGVLAQSSFNSYRTKKDEEVKQLKENLTRMASLQGAANNLDGDVQAEAQRQVLALEKVFEAQGYSLDDVREQVNALLNDPSALQTLNTAKESVINKEKEMPNNNLPSDKSYVDPKTFADVLQTGLTNVAVGGIHVQAEMVKALRMADKLGIELTDEQMDSLGNIVVSGAEKGKKPFEAIAEHLKFSEVQATKSKEQLDAQLQAAREEGRREALKDKGITITGRDKKINPHPIFDRERVGGKIDSRVDKIEDLPKNQMGTPEYFRLRRHDRETRRNEHASNAAERYAEVSQVYDNEGMFIGNRQQ